MVPVVKKIVKDIIIPVSRCMGKLYAHKRKNPNANAASLLSADRRAGEGQDRSAWNRNAGEPGRGEAAHQQHVIQRLANFLRGGAGDDAVVVDAAGTADRDFHQHWMRKGSTRVRTAHRV